jgi:hypothetical protein
MGNSTTTLQSVFDDAKAKGIPIPTDQPGGYGTRLALKIGNDVMSAIVAERFNPKWNRKTATPFLTNSYQQDYPQIGITDIGWGEKADKVDINNTSFPKPTNVPGITFVRDLSVTSLNLWPVNQICWLYNSQLNYGTWPGANVTFNPLLTTGPVIENPIMSMIDANGNLLIVTTIGTTGASAPVLPANSAEGTTVTDGSVIWTVVAGTSQGFRVFPLPGATGPVYQITPYYQMLLQKMATLGALINPIPDDQNYIFQVGIEWKCMMSSPNPQQRAEGMKNYPLWLKSLVDLLKQNDREPDAYGAFPADTPVESTYGVFRGLRNPQDPSQPY